MKLGVDLFSLRAQQWNAEFARFERLVRNAAPHMGPMINPATVDDLPPEFRDIVKGQERVDLERSVRYCRQTLGIGT